MAAPRRVRPGARLRRAALLACACVLAGALAQPAFAQAAAPALERAVKAAFVYKFLGYVEWPAPSFEHADTPIVVGVHGADDIAAELAQIVAGRAVAERPVQVKRLRYGDSVAGLHVLFVGRSDAARLAPLARALQSRPTLVVSESSNALNAGSMINLVLAPDGRVRFEIALDAVEKAGLKLSSRLLALAQSVRPGGS
jgi:hypothetical protein